ncbi:YacL family protein [Pantoea sp.]|uniref:YacL family protein n=1 Tax=Pantoea sp. TaxID=69393 RepID=UPI0028A05D12|nr:YacL family protein [Pantoea sp.]
MDYEFLHDVTGGVKVRLSVGHEAIGHWFNEEVQGDTRVLDEIIAAAAQLRGSERQWQRVGHEYTLWLDDEEVMVRANVLAFDEAELEEGMTFYDEESLAFCGKEDFLALIAAYRQFLRG